MSFLFVALGGFFGSVTRFYISAKLNKYFIGTLFANVTGSILTAFVLHYYLAGTISPFLWAFLGIGFCGAYTTFSTFGNETLQLLIKKRYFVAMSYVVGSLGISLFFVAVVFHML